MIIFSFYLFSFSLDIFSIDHSMNVRDPQSFMSSCYRWISVKRVRTQSSLHINIGTHSPHLALIYNSHVITLFHKMFIVICQTFILKEKLVFSLKGDILFSHLVTLNTLYLGDTVVIDVTLNGLYAWWISGMSIRILNQFPLETKCFWSCVYMLKGDKKNTKILSSKKFGLEHFLFCSNNCLLCLIIIFLKIENVISIFLLYLFHRIF